MKWCSELLELGPIEDCQALVGNLFTASDLLPEFEGVLLLFLTHFVVLH